MVIGKCITRAVSVTAGFDMLGRCLGAFHLSGLMPRLCEMGLDLDNWFVLGLALILFFCVSLMQERGINVREKTASLPLPVRWAIYMAGILSVIIFGVYGVGYDAASFIYRGF